MRDSWADWFQEDEELLWEGAPKPGINHLARNLFFTFFGPPFLGAGFFSSGMGIGMIFDPSAINFAFGLFLVCFGVPFLAVGGAMVFGGWYADLRAHDLVRYALSNRRAYIATHWWKRNMEILDIRPEHPIEVTDGRNVYFYTSNGVDSDGDKTTAKRGFENIADAETVYHLIRELQAEDISK